MTLLLAGVLARGGELAEGWIEVEGERVRAMGGGGPPREADERVEGILAPGLCDLQVNGAGGLEATAGPAALDAIDAIQLAHGVTSYLPTLVSPEEGTAERVLGELEERAADPSSPVAGAHVEGPFLNPELAGMHPRDRLRSPAEGVPRWLESGAVRMLTLAPELPGALELIGALRARGVLVSLGHSAANAETAGAAIEAGATAVTHVFNAMAPLRHRAPGLTGLALVDERLRVGVIPDGSHVAPLALELVRRAAGRRAFLVTDATPAAAAPPGRYEMAGREIEASGAAPARTLNGQLAGSALTLDEAMRNWAAMTGASVAEAIVSASEVPSATIGVPVLSPGASADLVVLDEEGNVRRAMRRGAWVDRNG